MIRKYSFLLTAVLAALVLVLPTGCGTAGSGSGAGNGNANGDANDNGSGDANDNGGDDMNDNGSTGNENVNDNSGGDDSGTATLTPVKTDIDVHNAGRIAVGDDLLVYGFGAFAGVDYIIPSEGDTAGRGIPNGDGFVAGSFAVSGKKIALVSNFLITIYDTATGTTTEIGEDQVRLVNTPSGIHSQGHPIADGPYIACRNNPSSNDGNMVVVIDVSGDVPVIINFTNDPENSVDHIAVDADAAQLAVSARDVFYIYDINDPTAPPTVYDTNPGNFGGVDGISENIFTLDGGFIFYEDDSDGGGNAVFLDVADGSRTTLTNNPAQGEQCHNGGTFVYMLNRDSEDSNGNDARGGYGTVPGPGSSLAGDEPIDGSTTNNGFFGWSQVCSVTPDGSLAFMSGRGSIGSGEFLQVSTGGAFSLIPDPDGSSNFGLPGTDVTTSATLVGFKTGEGTTTGSSTKVGYIILAN